MGQLMAALVSLYLNKFFNYIPDMKALSKLICSPCFRWSFLIGNEPCTVVNHPVKAQSPILEEVQEEEKAEPEVVEAEPAAETPPPGPQVEVIIQAPTDITEDTIEKSEEEATKEVNTYRIIIYFSITSHYITLSELPEVIFPQVGKSHVNW